MKKKEQETTAPKTVCEKRILSRILIHQAADIQNKNKCLHIPAVIINCSLNGLLIWCGQPEAFAIGDSIDVLFELTKDESIFCIEIGCMLLRKSGNELALKLEVIDYDSLMALKDYVGIESGDAKKIEQEFIGFLTTI